jgi:hypothetical protein
VTRELGGKEKEEGQKTWPKGTNRDSTPGRRQGRVGLSGGRIGLSGGRVSLRGGRVGLRGGRVGLRGGRIGLRGGCAILRGGSGRSLRGRRLVEEMSECVNGLFVTLLVLVVKCADFPVERCSLSVVED